MATKSTYQLLAEVIPWAIEAAREHVELSRFNGETPDPETSMGLWQSFQAKFQAKFPKHEGIAFPSDTAVDYDVLVTAYSKAYEASVKALCEFKPDGGRS